MIEIIFPADPKGDFKNNVSYKMVKGSKYIKMRRTGGWIDECSGPAPDMQKIAEKLFKDIDQNPEAPIDLPMGSMLKGKIGDFQQIGFFASRCTPAIFFQGDDVVAVHKNPSMRWEDVLRASELNFQDQISLFADDPRIVAEEINRGLRLSKDQKKIDLPRLIPSGKFERNSTFDVSLRREISRREDTIVGRPPRYDAEIFSGAIGGGEIGGPTMDRFLHDQTLGGEVPGGSAAGTGEIGRRIEGREIGGGEIGGHIR